MATKTQNAMAMTTWRGAHPMLPAKLGDGDASFRLVKDGKDLRFAESARLHQNFLVHKAREHSTFEARYLPEGLPINRNDRIEFGSNDLNLLEAVALGKGASQSTADMKGYFVFRYEEPDIVMDLLGKTRFQRLLDAGMQPDKVGRYPIVYQFDMSNPDSLIVGQTFPVKNRDVIYTSRHPSVDFLKFVNIVGRPIGVAAGVVSLTDDLSKL